MEGTDFGNEDPRPDVNVGKRKAKRLKSDEQKKKKGVHEDVRVACLLRIAEASEERTKIYSRQSDMHKQLLLDQQQLLFDQQQLLLDQQRLEFFRNSSDSAAKEEFFSLQAQEYLREIELEVAAKEKRIEEESKAAVGKSKVSSSKVIAAKEKQIEEESKAATGKSTVSSSKVSHIDRHEEYCSLIAQRYLRELKSEIAAKEKRIEEERKAAGKSRLSE